MRAGLGAGLASSPAVGSGGTLYFGAGNSLATLGRDGAPGWSAPTGALKSAVAVGMADAGTELVFYSDESVGFGVLLASDGGVLNACSDGPIGAQPSPALVWTTISGEPALTALMVRNTFPQPALTAFRGLAGASCAQQLLFGFTAGLGNAAVVNASTALHSAPSGEVVELTFDGSAWSPTGVAPSLANPQHGLALDVALASALTHGSRVGRFPLPLDAGQPLQAAGNTWGHVAVLAPGVWWAGSSSDGGTLHRFGPNAVAASAALTAPLATAPVLGAAGLVYTVAADGALEVRSTQDLALRWRLLLGGAVLANPTLDVGRAADGAKACSRPGTFYVLTASGQLFALLVDSRGLEPTAPWPRFQRDPRNTGNATSDLGEFTCP
jgi:hypothetical protein